MASVLASPASSSWPFSSSPPPLFLPRATRSVPMNDGDDDYLDDVNSFSFVLLLPLIHIDHDIINANYSNLQQQILPTNSNPTHQTEHDRWD